VKHTEHAEWSYSPNVGVVVEDKSKPQNGWGPEGHGLAYYDR